LPEDRFLVIKSLVVLLCRQCHGIMVGLVRLYDSDALLRPTPGTPGHLAKELESSLTGPEVGKMETNIGKDSAHQGNGRDMQALGHHLSPHQHLGFSTGELFHYGLAGTTSGGHIPVPSKGGDSW
jgi:hypothetical protein